jgi:transcriptional regulator with XRE-family HTH domain
MGDASSNLALNVRQLRSARQLSQAELAKIAGIPRPTLAHLESGSANPTLSVLMRLASALQVLIEELVAPPRAQVRHFSADQLPQRQRGMVAVRKLLPEHIRGLDIERMALPAGSDFVGIPHIRGSRAYLICERGALRLTIGGEEFDMVEGDVLVFRGDQRHSYENPGTVTAVGYSVVTLAPVPDELS